MRYNQLNHSIFDQTKESHRHAYNAVFGELGLSWQWDLATYSRLEASGGELVRIYLENEQAHLLRAYDADFLINLIETAKAKCEASKKASWHPHAQQAMATTGSFNQLAA